MQAGDTVTSQSLTVAAIVYGHCLFTNAQRTPNLTVVRMVPLRGDLCTLLVLRPAHRSGGDPEVLGYNTRVCLLQTG